MSPAGTRLSVDARTRYLQPGCCAYEMITGSSPFAGRTISDIIASILTTEPLPLVRYSPEIPDRLQRIVSRSMAKERVDRYDSIVDLAVDLKSLRQDLEFNARLKDSDQQEQVVAKALAIPGFVRHSVGRNSELAQLRTGFESAAGTRAADTVSGEAGIGKTTIVEDFLSTLTAARKQAASCAAGVRNDSPHGSLFAISRGTRQPGEGRPEQFDDGRDEGLAPPVRSDCAAIEREFFGRAAARRCQSASQERMKRE